jgi:methyl-accepting chemotaxis protein
MHKYTFCSRRGSVQQVAAGANSQAQQSLECVKQIERLSKRIHDVIEHMESVANIVRNIQLVSA